MTAWHPLYLKRNHPQFQNKLMYFWNTNWIMPLKYGDYTKLRDQTVQGLNPLCER